MLPCKAKAGFASLLNSYSLADADAYSMSISLKQENDSLKFSQKIDLIFDPSRTLSSSDFSLSKIFKETLKGSCPLSQSSKLMISLPHTTTPYSFHEQPNHVQYHKKKENPDLSLTATYNINKRINIYLFYAFVDSFLLETKLSFDTGVNWGKESEPFSRKSLSLFNIHRYLTGYGQESGGINIDFYNNHPIENASVTYIESLPWHLRVYLHTLQIRVMKGHGKAEIETMVYQPAIDRKRPSLLQITLQLPANTKTTFSFEFDKAFIRYSEHSPDSQRGYDIP
ncbi:hypothetical protein HK096_003294, partial [Nowakowskiella sp. JEL0078]